MVNGRKEERIFMGASYQLSMMDRSLADRTVLQPIPELSHSDLPFSFHKLDLEKKKNTKKCKKMSCPFIFSKKVHGIASKLTDGLDFCRCNERRDGHQSFRNL